MMMMMMMMMGRSIKMLKKILMMAIAVTPLIYWLTPLSNSPSELGWI
jgi:hypothetical protein